VKLEQSAGELMGMCGGKNGEDMRGRFSEVGVKLKFVVSYRVTGRGSYYMHPRGNLSSKSPPEQIDRQTDGRTGRQVDRQNVPSPKDRAQKAGATQLRRQKGMIGKQQVCTAAAFKLIVRSIRGAGCPGRTRESVRELPTWETESL
jgi:hypothetical protein